MAMKFSDTFGSESRFSDVKCGLQRRRLPPIQGFEEKPLVSLEEAVKPLESIVPQVQQMVWTVKGSCSQPKDGLSEDESASIMLYTLEWTPSNNSFYFILNATLRSEDRRKLVPWFLYLRLVIFALSKLPSSSPRVIYRGIQLDLSEEYSIGNEYVWWPFSSCTLDIGVLETHIGQTGNRTIFNIQCRSTIDISRHSYYQTEKEYLLYPARQFKVTSKLNAGNGLHIIDLEETEPPFPFFRMPSAKNQIDQIINILLIGEKGVGKSTFINAFVNYLRFKTIEQVQFDQPIVLKPLSFIMTINDTFEMHTVKFGNFDHLHQPITEQCQTYTFDLKRNGGKKLRFIDTPSFENTDDSNENYSNKIKRILEYVNNLTHLNAVCFLLKPDALQLLNSFKSCFDQLLKRLGSNARKNIIFCFTNALITFSTPGSTASLLREMFMALSMDMPFSRENTFFFENESFRYLIATQNGIQFSHEDTREYTTSWTESVTESRRLLDYICTKLIRIPIVKK